MDGDHAYLVQHRATIEHAVGIAVAVAVREQAANPVRRLADALVREDLAPVTTPEPADEEYLRYHAESIERALTQAVRAVISSHAAEPLSSLAVHLLQQAEQAELASQLVEALSGPVAATVVEGLVRLRHGGQEQWESLLCTLHDDGVLRWQPAESDARTRPGQRPLKFASVGRKGLVLEIDAPQYSRIEFRGATPNSLATECLGDFVLLPGALLHGAPIYAHVDGMVEAHRAGPALHWGITCDVSGASPIIGNRYKKRDEDYDLCSKEYGNLDPQQQAEFTCIEQPAEVGPAVHWGVACDACPEGSSNLLGSRYKKVGGISAATRTLVFPPAFD